jgi:iduronate 2-sulfatase
VLFRELTKTFHLDFMFRIPLLFSMLLLPVMGEKPNILLICVDDLRPELKSFGVDYVHSPAMDSLVASGRAFTRHYVQAPTCGASRYALLTGKYGTTGKLRNNDAIMSIAGQSDTEPFSLPKQFRENGYRTVSIGKVSHYCGGLGGKDWADPEKVEMPGAWDLSMMPTGPWKTPQKAMHGYADGKPRIPGGTAVQEHKDGDDFTYTDGWIAREALSQMDDLAAKKEPFFLAVGLMKPHLPFACPKAYLDLYKDVKLPAIPHPEKPTGLSTWHGSGEFFGNYLSDDPRTDPTCADEMRKSYLACVSYSDAQVAKILKKLDELKLSENTIVILWGDHGWHLGEHNVWGKHTLFEESLRAPLVIRYPGMKKSGVSSHAVVETVDIFPTICELAGVAIPKGISGKSLMPQLSNPEAPGGVALSFGGKAETIRTPEYRLIRHSQKNGKFAYELYDHRGEDGETQNLAEEKPELVKELNALLDTKMR